MTMFDNILKINNTNLHVTKYLALDRNRYFLESCVYEIDDAIAIITYNSYRLDKEDIPIRCRN